MMGSTQIRTRRKALFSLVPVMLMMGIIEQNGCKTRRAEPPTFAFIDTAGRVKIHLHSRQAARSFAEGLAAVSLDDKWGFIDPNGSFVIQPQFGWVGDFSEGLALVTTASTDHYWDRDTLFGYIDRTGKYVIRPRFNWGGRFAEGLAPVCIGSCRGSARSDLIGYIGRDGKYVLAPEYGAAGPFSEGLAVAGAGATGFINKTGVFVIPRRFIFAQEFAEGLAVTDQGFINHRGEIVIAREAAAEGGDFSSGWAAVLEGERPVYIDKNGQVTLRPGYQAVGPFSNGLATACVSNCGPSAFGAGQNWGFMDKSGKFVISPQFGYRPQPFRDGLALVCFGCKG